MTHDQMLATLALLGWERIGHPGARVGISRWRNCGRNLYAYRWCGDDSWMTMKLAPWFKGLPAIEPTAEDVAAAFVHIVEGGL